LVSSGHWGLQPAIPCRHRRQAAAEAAAAADILDRAEAAAAIGQGKFLLRSGYSQTGLTERYVGRLHQLRGEWRESIEPLLAARGRLAGTDLVACDQAIVQAYLKVGDVAAARRIVDQGRRNAGRLANAYTAMAAAIDAAGSTAVPDP
jgi:hypothetical protein